MAMPHCAIAQLASCSETSTKAARACSYWKECNRATARLKLTRTVVEQEVTKCTEPSSWSVREWSCHSSHQRESANRVRKLHRRSRLISYLCGYREIASDYITLSFPATARLG